MLWQAKGWSAVVLLSLALGIGAKTAIFTAINRLLLHQKPVRDPELLVRLRYAGRNDMVTNSSDYGYTATSSDGLPVRATFSYAMYQQFVADNKTMSDLVAGAPYGRVTVVIDGQADTANAFISTGNFYQVLGVTARLGRTLLPEDDRADAPPAAVISSKYWHSRFLTDPGVLGKTIRVNNVLVTIVGVLAPGFTGIQNTTSELADVSLPMALEPQLNTTGQARLPQPTNWWLQVVGRLKPGMTAAQVQGNLGGVFQQTARAGLDTYMKSISEAERTTARNRNRTSIPRLRVDSASRGIYDVQTTELRMATILSVVVALVLLIVCANVANLLLSRATAREREISIRLSLGATRWRIVRQLLTESLLLAFLGGALGLLVAYWGRQLLPGSVGEAPLFDWRVLAFVFAVTGLTGIIFGLAPAIRASRGDVNSALKQSGRSVVASRSVLGKSLIVVQVAISLVLLVGSGLFLRTLYNLRTVDVGFNPHNLLLLRISPGLNRYDEKRTIALYGDLQERIAAVPGVKGVALAQPSLLSGSINTTSLFAHGRVYAGPDEGGSIRRLVVSPNFFELMEIPILAGRALTPRDNDTAPKVAVINEAAAKKHFPNENPVGRRFGNSIEQSGQFEIVGIARDAKYSDLREPAPPTMYVPYFQTRVPYAVIEVRTAADPATVTSAVREAVKQVDPNLTMTDVSTQLEQVDRRLQQERMFASAYTLFGGLALLLAAIGLFGVMSYSVARRTNEIGIRMALGAQRTDVLRLVMRESMILMAVGVVVGVAVALGAGRLIKTLLYGLAASDTVTLTAAVALMVVVSALAGFLPARRASRVDPMVALRYD